MNLTPYFLEEHVREQVARISAQRDAADFATPPPAFIGRLRQRLGMALINAGERIGGIRAHEPVPVPVEPHTASMLSFGL